MPKQKPNLAKSITVLVFSLLVYAACGQEGSSPDLGPQARATPMATTSPGMVTFTQVSQDILKPDCVSCHNSGHMSGNVDLSNYAAVATQVVAGNPAQSNLYNAVASGRMPPSGPLSQAQVQEIANWIAQGALNN